MNRLFYLSVIPLAATATVASVMMASTPAQALSVRGCLPFETVGDFITNSSCQDQDKIYTIDASNTSTTAKWLDGLAIISTDEIDSDLHRLTYSRIGALPWTDNGNTFSLAYTIEIAPGSNQIFDRVSLGVDVAGEQNGMKAVKQVWSDGFNGANSFGTLTTINDNPSAPVFLDVAGTKLWVIDTVTRTSPRGNFNSFTNTYAQEAVPEPLTILGTGLALGLGGVFKNKSSKRQSAEV